MNIKEKYPNIFECYFLWKTLNSKIKKEYSRGINIPEYITENLCCIVNNYKLCDGSKSSEDAVTMSGEKVQIKASSNFNNDLTSFGPKSKFDILEFVRLDQDKDVFYLYKIDTDYLNDIFVNKKETWLRKKKTGQRPRFSIIKKIIEPKNLCYYAQIDMNTGNIIIK